jgi:hypothetical protein
VLECVKALEHGQLRVASSATKPRDERSLLHSAIMAARDET